MELHNMKRMLALFGLLLTHQILAAGTNAIPQRRHDRIFRKWSRPMENCGSLSAKKNW